MVTVIVIIILIIIIIFLVFLDGSERSFAPTSFATKTVNVNGPTETWPPPITFRAELRVNGDSERRGRDDGREEKTARGGVAENAENYSARRAYIFLAGQRSNKNIPHKVRSCTLTGCPTETGAAVFDTRWLAIFKNTSIWLCLYEKKKSVLRYEV